MQKNSKASPPQAWAASTASLVSNFGLAKRVLRLAPDVTIQGGRGAGVYHEQVSVSQATSEDKKENTKPLRRGARILLCFVASKPGTKPSLAVLDFGLMWDDTLCDSPATLLLLAISLSASSVKGRTAQRASTPLLYWAENEGNSTVRERSVASKTALKQGVQYKVFLSRALVHLNKQNDVPRPVQLVTMRAWDNNGNLAIKLSPPSITDLETSVNRLLQTIDLSRQGPAQACGFAQNNDSPPVFGGAPWATEGGLVGFIGPTRFYSAAIKVPESHTTLCIPDNTERSKIG